MADKYVKVSDIEEYCDINSACMQGQSVTLAALRRVKEFAIENAVDVQPVKRGKWVYYKNYCIWDIYKCTVCDTPFELPMKVVPSSVFCYCPHCGAYMRGDENG